jgi:hypothetical protein
MAADLREEEKEKEKRAGVASTVVKSLSRNWPDVHYIPDDLGRIRQIDEAPFRASDDLQEYPQYHKCDELDEEESVTL